MIFFKMYIWKMHELTTFNTHTQKHTVDFYLSPFFTRIKVANFSDLKEKSDQLLEYNINMYI
jgi:hypothetical protein